MSLVRGTIAVLLLATAFGDAFAQTASFRTSIHILPERVATGTPVDLPVPPQAQVLPPSRHSKRYLVAGRPDQARRFYEDTLPGLGFYLAQQRDNGAVWERSDVRAELLFHPVVGGRDATGIIVTLSPRST